MQVDAVVLSDLHLGAEMCRVDAIETRLTDLPETKRVILNGDVLESSDHRLRKSHWRILSLLRKLSDDIELVWVKGNHDPDAEAVAHIIGAKFCNDYEFISGDKRILCVHGDAWDDFITKYPITTIVADFIYLRLQKYFPSLAFAAKKNSKTFLRCCEKVKCGAITMAKKRNCDVVLCGHTHQFERADGYFNGGCWTEAECHFMVVDQGNVFIHQDSEHNYGGLV